VIALERLLQRPPLRVREAHEHSTAARVRDGRPPELRHGLADITISGTDKGCSEETRDAAAAIAGSAARSTSMGARSAGSAAAGDALGSPRIDARRAVHTSGTIHLRALPAHCARPVTTRRGS
jgi:hypothetical protein